MLETPAPALNVADYKCELPHPPDPSYFPSSQCSCFERDIGNFLINIEGSKTSESEPKTVLCVYVCDLKLCLVLTIIS